MRIVRRIFGFYQICFVFACIYFIFIKKIPVSDNTIFVVMLLANFFIDFVLTRFEKGTAK